MMDPSELLIMEALSGGKGGGTSDYTALQNLPTINGETVTGDLSGADLHLATLDSSGLVPPALLPSYVDDVLEYDSALDFPAEGETDKIYLAKNTSTQYRWSGTQYIVIARYIPPATAAPLMDGTAAVGSAEAYAREDHVHPTDTSRASTAPAVSGGANGLMTGADKAKLDLLSVPASGVSIPEILSNSQNADTPVNFTSAAAGRPLRVAVNIEAVQAGSGDPYPPGGGRNFVNWADGTTTLNGVTAVCANGVITLSGTASAITQFYTGVPSLPDGQYILNGCPDGGSQTTFDLRGTSNIPIDYGNGAAFSSSSGSFNSLFITIRSGVNTNGLVFRPMVRLASDPDPTFAPYANIRPISGRTGAAVTVSPNAQGTGGTTYSFSFPTSAGTIYGGTLDARGLLTVTHRFANGTTVMTGVGQIVNSWYAADFSSSYRDAARGYADIICDCYKGINNASQRGELTAYLLDGTLVYVDSRFQTVEAANEILAALTPHIVYKLNTPIMYQLTPQQLSSLNGANYVSADCGPVTVTHWPGTGTPVEPVDMAADVEQAQIIADLAARVAALEV